MAQQNRAAAEELPFPEDRSTRQLNSKAEEAWTSLGDSLAIAVRLSGGGKVADFR